MNNEWKEYKRCIDCKRTYREIHESDESVYAGRCAPCFAKRMAEEGLTVGEPLTEEEIKKIQKNFHEMFYGKYEKEFKK